MTTDVVHLLRFAAFAVSGKRCVVFGGTERRLTDDTTKRGHRYTRFATESAKVSRLLLIFCCDGGQTKKPWKRMVKLPKICSLNG